MPKERRDRSVSRDSCRVSPFPCSSSPRTLAKIPSENEENVKEWEDARCPVCMEHPHNAVLLICSSHEKGCRPYMCDTSYRHSNCLDQFRKSFAAETPSTVLQQEEMQLPATHLSPAETSESTVTDLSESTDTDLSESTVTDMQEEIIEEGTPTSCENQTPAKLLCPLCRGQIKEWIVVEPARRFMNAKSRSCSCETCNFSGSYTDLRKHARLEHPLVRPSDADPERQRNWRRLEHQWDLGDLLSTLQSTMAGDDRDGTILPTDDGSWLTVFFLIRVFRPGSTGSSSRSNSWSGASRTRLRIRRRPSRLWGESYEEGARSASREEENESSDDGSGSWRPRQRIRRRTTPDNLP
ncbi:uncharacterized protein LOC107429853 [Ziziphus jujuba]|uniref:Uncharacterized protein LOC107429853 n=2 Tax=Ziziphus jujuba TaxID=326968 RepID=A0A6P6FW26_ZIZJJ|nr:uncharacterized protein LOC107429853 [Ziziphus jujuba]XP_024925701.1 uncharacterized protein LOC107429853 [Ziziphus jujuba]XP_048327312.1 uncharacterized protein LOC107429853 [Ziziphus jujuba var. spinosa]XP_048327314.1 uncharacterized protein LOC107429853 [Ziziphus jujuba]XP_048327323.1 uncharacterized protein LOC107429853 [Ziziphus jujuba]KAH7546462.1 hypothetical protein FEM48_Zijuj01G0203300 [Ziziphus jujuba var. spinosa]